MQKLLCTHTYVRLYVYKTTFSVSFGYWNVLKGVMFIIIIKFWHEKTKH
jgi:hypothetical protein